MIGLTIDGVQVNFKQDTNFEYYKENPSLAAWEAIEKILKDCELIGK